ncbi:type III secretion system inner membrane ring lipoprotein SctJ [Propionivibrio soli]|uniref:type III secretion system inner membrane ring lipoprotein SctJ n=1 Tax=Propionivibrio soli TaxID=2976531 RepID=UPI0023DF3254|nr:type III secretion inner membrane ring lipoprotein SctJ [Propionivibrio soli]
MRTGIKRVVIRYCLVAVAAILVAACGSRVELMASMPEEEANEVIAALMNAGIAASKIPGKEGMVGLSVEASQVGRAVDLLRAKGLPRERHPGMGDVFKKEGLISSPLEERARYIYALSQELRDTLAQIDGVITARVHVVLPERNSSGEPLTPSTAAVFIKHQEGYNLDTVQPQIRKLVTNSIPSLSPERVSIVLIGAQTPPASGENKPTESAAATGGVPVAVAVVLAVLALLSTACAGFLAWKFWLPARRQAAAAGNEGGH